MSDHQHETSIVRDYEAIYSQCRQRLGTTDQLTLASELLLQVIETLPNDLQIDLRARVFAEVRRIVQAQKKATRVIK